MALSAGTDVGPFRLDTQIGVGGMGEVWRAHHRMQGTPVAIKVVTSSRARHERYREVFLREVQAVAALNHPGVVAIYDYGELDMGAEESTLPWYGMELAETSLGDVYLQDWGMLHRVLVEILDALAHAHARGVIHRDLKPENVLLTEDLSVKLTDFGMAHVVEQSQSTGNVFGPGGGTPEFMAPEQFRGSWRKFGPWTDLYALGCVAWELATGSPPHAGSTVVEIAMRHINDEPPSFAPLFDVPRRFEVWLRQLVQKHPLDRYRRAADAQWALVHDVGATEASRHVTLRSRPGVPTASQLEVNVPAEAWRERATLATEGRPSVLSTVQATYSLTPPFPETWRTDHVPTTLGGSGLGLFGIREIPFVDRDEQRETIWEALREVDSTRGNRVVLVRAEPGMGRTRLGQWISRRADELGAATVVRAYHAPIPSRRDGLSGAITRFLGIEGVDQERAEDIVFDRLGPVFDARPLLDLLYKPTQDDGGRATSTFTAPTQRFATLERLFSHLAWERTVILFADDVQWGADTLLFIQHLLGRKTRTLVLATVRDDAIPDRYWESQLVDELRRAEQCRELPLSPLDGAARLELIEQMLDLEDSLLRRVAQRSQGIPLFAVQLVGDWVQRGLLTESEQGFRLRGDVGRELPDDVYGLWTRRIDDLAVSLQQPRVRDLLEIAAVLGRGDRREWPAACGSLGLDIPRSLVDELVTRRLAHREADGWVFRHTMLREALERSVEESGRAPAVYAACAAAVDPRDPYRAAELQVRAGQYDAAIDSLIRALEMGLASAAVDQSLQLVEVIRELLEEVHASPRDRRRGLIAEAQVSLTALAGHAGEARRLASQLVEDAARHGWRTVEADARLHLGMLGQQLEETNDDVLREFDEALAIFDELDDDLGRARAYRALARFHLFATRPVVADGLLEKAWTIFNREGDEDAVVDCLVTWGDIELSQKRWEFARTRFDEALVLARSLRIRHLEGAALNGLARVARRVGDVEQAEELFVEARRVWASVGSPSADEAAVNLGLLLISLSRFDDARPLLRDVSSRVEDVALPTFAPVLYAATMVLAAEESRSREFDRARERLTRVLHRGIAQVADVAQLAFQAGKIWAERRDRSRARSSFDIARNHFLALGEQKLADEVAIAIGQLVAAR